MSGAIVASGFILKMMPSIDIFTAFSIIVVAGAMGIAAFLLLRAVGKMKLKPKDIVSILLLPLILPVIALGIVLSSLILQFVKPIDDPIALIITSAAIGLAVLFMTPTMRILSKVGLQAMLIGGLGVVVAATAIMLSSWILSVGNYDKYPSLKWSLGTGLAIILFTPAIVLLGLIAMSGVGALAVLAGAGMVVIVAAAITAVSHILSKGKYKSGPPLFWAIGTALLITTFGVGMLLLGVIPFGKKILDRGTGMMLKIASAIKESSFILAGGKYTGGPTKAWAEGVALSLGAFSNALLVSGKATGTSGLTGMIGRLFGKEKKSGGDQFVDFIRNVSYGMVAAAEVLSTGKWGAGPTPDWGKGVGASLGAFTHALEVSMEGGKGLNFFSDNKFGPKDFPNFIKSVAWGMVAATEVLSRGKWEEGPSKAWGEGVGSSLKPFIDLFSALNSSPKAKMLMKDLKKSKKKGKQSIISDFIRDIAWDMVAVSGILRSSKGWTGGPSKEWGDGVGSAIDVMITITKNSKNFNFMDMVDFKLALATLASLDIRDIIKIHKRLGLLGSIDKKSLYNIRYLMRSLSINKSQIDGIKNFAKAVKELSRSFNSLKRSGIDKLNKFTGSVTILSAVDKNQLASIIGVLADNKDKLGEVTKATSGGGIGFPGIRQRQEKVQTFDIKKALDLSPGEKVLSEKFDTVIEKFDEVLELMVKDSQGEDAGKKDRVRSPFG